MSELLKDVMKERALATETPHLDLDAIVASGNKRIRRHRSVAAVAAGAAVAAFAAVAVAVPALVDEEAMSGPDQLRPAQGGPFEERTTTYAAGSVIHYGVDEVDVAPHSISSFVQTDDGFVFTDELGAVFLATGDSVDAIGQTKQPYGAQLAAGDSGSYVTWLDTEASTFKVYDTAVQSEVASVEQLPQAAEVGEFGLLSVLALDGSTAYWHTADGVVGYDVDNDKTEVVEAGASTQWLADVAKGTLARMSFDDQAITVSADPDASSPNVPGSSHADLSPDARYVATDAEDTEQVFETATGEDVTPAADGYSFVAVVQWSDGDSYTALGIRQGNREDDPVDLLTCSVSAGICAVAEPSVGTFADLQFPIGEDTSDE